MSVQSESISRARLIARQYASANMNATVEAVRPVRVEPGSAEGTVMKLLYRGPARLHGIGGPSNQSLGDELTTFASSSITTPVRADDSLGVERFVDLQVDDLFRVLDQVDELIVGRVFTVIDVDYGGIFAVFRSHQVTSVQPSAEWRYSDEAGVVPW